MALPVLPGSLGHVCILRPGCCPSCPCLSMPAGVRITPGTCQLHAQTCLAILSPPSLTELPREGEVSGQHSLAELVKFPFSLGPIGCWLTGLTADGGSWLLVLVSGCGPGSWAEMEMVTLWQRLSEVGCPQKQSLRQGLGAGVYLREDFMKQE